MVVGTTGIYILLSAMLGIELAQAFGLRYTIRIDERTENIMKTVMSKTKITKIVKGTVIDHIPTGKAFDILEALGLKENEDIVTIALNLKSDKMGKKDLIKVEGKKLKEEDWKKIKEITGKPTVNIIEDWKVKKKVRLPEF